MMMLATILGLLLLAAWLYSCTSPTFVPAALEQAEQDLAAAQDWADELESSLCPMHASFCIARVGRAEVEIPILTTTRTHHAHAA